MKSQRAVSWLVPAILAFAGCGSDLQSPVSDESLPPAAIHAVTTEASGWIGPMGGALTVNGVTLTVPEGALESLTQITMRKLASGAVELEPDGQTFAVPVQLLFVVAVSGDCASYATQWYDPDSQQWVDIPSTSMMFGRVAPLEHFSMYRIVAIR